MTFPPHTGSPVKYTGQATAKSLPAFPSGGSAIRWKFSIIGRWYNNELACEDISNDWQQSFYWFWNMALFVPKAWKWYSYIDINATELVVAVRAIMDIYTPEKRKNKQNGSIGTSWNTSI